jgi:hypothetical protein
MSLTLDRPRLPAEHLGQARLLRRRLAAADDNARAVCDAAWQHVLQCHQTLGRVLADTARVWEQRMPAYGSVSRSIRLGKHSLDISEARLCGDATFRFLQWEDDEREASIALVRLMLTCGRKRSQINHEKIAHLSLHAVTRWHERTRQHDDAAFHAACLPLLDRYAGLVQALQDEFDIPTIGGRWLGHLARLQPETCESREIILAVRTYIPNGE